MNSFHLSLDFISPDYTCTIPGRETVVVEEVSDNMVTVTVHEIEDVQLSDGGVFVCTAHNKLGSDERTTTLTIGCK